ncbi:MAG: rRNA maturation RNase YbeY [Cyclobacteriaceae bacterium]|nr:rRNA maturation RNase YbeY [Cyclobacteriaceae bacterium]
MAVRFFSEEITFKIAHPRKTTSWIKEVIKKEKGQLDELNYIFCSDKYLLSINQQYLKHNTLTDIITFSNAKKGQPISGDIYISIERVKENAKQFKTSFDEELHRVIIHGILHLLGYKDKKPDDKALMRKKEEAYLSLRK